MEILLGSSCLLNHPPLHSQPPRPRGHLRLHRRKKPRPAAVACEEGWRRADGLGGPRRRTFLLVGTSVFPFLKLRAVAAEVLALKDEEHPEGRENLQSSSSESHTEGLPANVLGTLLNAIGLLGSGILGSLYALSRDEKAAVNSTAQSMKSLLEEQEAATASMEKGFELRMLDEQEVRWKEMEKLKEEEAALSNNLASANLKISVLGEELRKEKRVLEELQMQLHELGSHLSQAGREKAELEGRIEEKVGVVDDLQDRVSLLSLEVVDKETSIGALKRYVSDKESEAMGLKLDVQKTRNECQNASSVTELLKIEAQQIREVLDSKVLESEKLNVEIEKSLIERTGSARNFQLLQKEYNDLESTTTAKVELDSKLSSKKDEELQALEEKLAVITEDACKGRDLVERIVCERDRFRAMMEEEAGNVKRLQQELESMYKSMEAAKFELSSLSELLVKSEGDRKRLEIEVSKFQSESLKMEILMRQNIDDAKIASSQLSEELRSVKGTLGDTKVALDSTSVELRNALEDQAALKRELLEVYKRAESIGRELEESRSMVTSLQFELETSYKQLLSGNEAREALTINLNDVTQALEEMNRTSSSLSRELEITRSRNASLEMENQVLSRALSDQEKVTLEARDDIQDAQDLLRKLVEERDGLEKKSTRLEGELAMAKGKILRMRRNVGAVSGESVGEEVKGEKGGDSATSSSARRNAGKRGGGPPA